MGLMRIKDSLEKNESEVNKMGCVNNISFDRFPVQGNFLGKRVAVCFHYDTNRILKGTIIRDDREEPGETIIMLDDGRVVKASECQYSIIR